MARQKLSEVILEDLKKKNINRRIPDQSEASHGAGAGKLL